MSLLQSKTRDDFAIYFIAGAYINNVRDFLCCIRDSYCIVSRLLNFVILPASQLHQLASQRQQSANQPQQLASRLLAQPQQPASQPQQLASQTQQSASQPQRHDSTVTADYQTYKAQQPASQPQRPASQSQQAASQPANQPAIAAFQLVTEVCHAPTAAYQNSHSSLPAIHSNVPASQP